MHVELREHDRRISGLHRSLGTLSIDVGAHKTDIEVLKRDVREVRDDVADLGRTIEKEGEKNRAALKESDERFAKALNDSDEKFKAASNRMVAAILGFALSAAGSAITVAMTLGGSP